MYDSVAMVGGSITRGGALTLTGSVQNLPDSGLEFITIWVQANASNSNVVELVDSQGNVMLQITAGTIVSLDVSNTQAFSVKGTASQSIFWGGIVK